MHKKTKQYFVWLGLFSILAWIVTVISLIAFMLIKGGPPVPPTPVVPQALYMNVVSQANSLAFFIIPIIAAGYLVIGVLIFNIVNWSKNDQS